MSQHSRTFGNEGPPKPAQFPIASISYATSRSDGTVKARIAFLDHVQIRFGPSLESNDDRHQALGARGKGVFDAQRPQIPYRTGHEAVALKVPNRL
jgi:hypothetical protein